MAMKYKPMLAYPANSKPIDYEQPVFIQAKLDGVRCLIQSEYDETSKSFVVKAYSRTGKEWKNINHILFNLKGFFELNPDVVLDGELYNHKLKDDFEQIISLVRKQKPTDGDRYASEKLVQFHCYDIIVATTEMNKVVNENNDAYSSPSFYDRNKWIRRNVPNNHVVTHVKTTRVSEIAAKTIHDAHLQWGYEGSIVRLNGHYEQKRSFNLRKFKDFQDSEAKIIGFVEGVGKRTGTIGKFIAEDDDGNIFGMPVMDNFVYLKDNFKKMQKWVGKTATFTYFERTKAQSYRHPLFKCIRDYE